MTKHHIPEDLNLQ